MKEIKRLKEIINRQIFLELYSKKWRDLYRPELEKALNDVEAKVQNEVERAKADKRVLDSFLQDTKLLLIRTPLDVDTKYMIRELLTLLYNWNRAFENNNEFELDVLLAIRLIDEVLTIAEYLSISRELIKHLENLLHFNPPIFELSKHYLKMLLDKYEVEQEDE